MKVVFEGTAVQVGSGIGTETQLRGETSGASMPRISTVHDLLKDFCTIAETPTTSKGVDMRTGQTINILIPEGRRTTLRRSQKLRITIEPIE